MAREKVLYQGHAVAAVAATSEKIAREALKLIEVQYEILPHVLDPRTAAQPNAPVLHENQFTFGLTHPLHSHPISSALQKANEVILRTGFTEADLVIEREFLLNRSTKVI